MWCLSPFSPPLLPNLGWKLCCTHSALSLVSGYLRCEWVWNSVRSKWEGGKVRKKSSNLDVDGEFFFFYAKERRRVETDDNTCMIKWKLKPCFNDSFTQKECSHADNFYYSAIDVGIYFPMKLASDAVRLLWIAVKNGAGIASVYRECRCLWRNWFDLASPWQLKISLLNLHPRVCEVSVVAQKKTAGHHKWCFFTCYYSCVLFLKADTHIIGLLWKLCHKKMSWPSIRY